MCPTAGSGVTAKLEKANGPITNLGEWLASDLKSRVTFNGIKPELDRVNAALFQRARSHVHETFAQLSGAAKGLPEMERLLTDL